MDKRIHKCVDIALAPLLPWKVNRPEEKIMMHPIISIEHVHYVVDKLLSQVYDDSSHMWRNGGYDEDEYYVNISETPGLHPAYMLGTIIALLWAKPKKIWIECFLSAPGEETIYLGNPVTGRLLKRFLKEFPELELVKFQASSGQKRGIQFINEHPNITHIVELGDGIGACWKKKFYKNDVIIHYPTALLVWMNYSSLEKIRKDRLLEQFGEYCFHESYSYWCGCDREMKGFADELGNLGFTCHGDKTWDQFAAGWKDFSKTEHLAVLVFHDLDLNSDVFEHKWEAPFFKIENGADYNPDKLYYNFQNLFSGHPHVLGKNPFFKSSQHPV